MRRHLPSMKALQAFEAASRHLNFTRAAIELNVTQTAISHQIRNLEDGLQIKLFSRENGRLRLTEAGARYASAIGLSIAGIVSATERASDEQRDDILTIGCLGTFQIKCLLPNIADFHERHPEIVLRFKTLIPNAPPARPDFDVAIQYGVGDWPDVVAQKLGDEEVFPVCSPKLLERSPPLDEPEDLRHHTVIRARSPLIIRDDWPFWLERAGVPGLSFANEISCDLLYPSIHAAIEGLGIMMGRTAIVRHDIARGLLVEPFKIRLPSPSAYYLLVPEARLGLSKVDAFKNWMLKTFALPPGTKRRAHDTNRY